MIIIFSNCFKKNVWKLVDYIEVAYEMSSQKYMRNKNEVFTCLMDNTKAFVLVRFSKLFIKLFNVGLARIFLRLIITIYTLQFANVRWNNGFSEIFSIQDRGPYYWDFCTVFTVFSYLKN